MASGKSLELAAIKRPEPKRVCFNGKCNLTWDQHLKKDGTRKKIFDNDKHGVAGYPGQTRRVH